MSIGERIKEERERLGYTQPAFAALGDASKNSQLSWEKELAFPNAKVMAAWAAIGADVAYILTGQRTGGASAPAPARAVSEGDRVMLENFHAAPAQVQAGIKTTLGAFADTPAQLKGRKRAA